VQNSVVFRIDDHLKNDWEQYLQSLIYDGATQFGCLDLSSQGADAIFLFSDGKNSYGSDMPNTGTSLVYCINSTKEGNLQHLSEIAGSNGGKCIDLNTTTVSDAIIQAGQVQTWLLQIASSRGKIICDQLLPIKSDKNILLTGILSDPSDTLTLYYGHGKEISDTRRIYVTENNCDDSTIKRVNMLQQFSMIQNLYSWDDMLEFGLKEKTVTPYTSFIVLEKVEDYIRYNIAPPKDLEEDCLKLNYVKKDTRSQRQKLKQQDEFDILNGVVHSYNSKIKQWDKSADTIQFNRGYQNSDKGYLHDETSNDNSASLTGKISGLTVGAQGSALNEVVVVGYGAAVKRDLTGAVTTVIPRQIHSGFSIEENLQGRVAGVSVQSSANYFSTQPSVRIRGISSLPNSNPLYIIDGVPINGNPNIYININDIETITVLKDAAAAAIYGGLGGNGVIIIKSRRGRNTYFNSSHRTYRLKDMEDVDYLQDLKQLSNTQLVFRYHQLREDHLKEPGFYLDVAQYLFERGLKQEAIPVLLNAAEAGEGNSFVLKAVGYVLESWKNFEEAIKIYEQLLLSDPGNLYTTRDLGWAYYQNGDYQKAVETLYDAIKLNLAFAQDRYTALKAIILDEMNAMITSQTNKVNISMIPAALIKPLPVDLKILVEQNNDSGCDLIIIEPGGSECSSFKPQSKQGGFMNSSNWPSYYYNPVEYQIRKAVKGTYRVRVRYFDHQSPGRLPSMIRITTFKNFGKVAQSINIENVIMDNQYGEIEIGEAKWEE